MKISQCLIVKNEEENIEYCLKHLKPIVNEQIVVDTGSKDRTVEIAEKMGAKIYHYKWIDDFSAARNFALDKAIGDWIIFLDCDEYFSESSIPWILKSIEKSEEYKTVDSIMCELINIDSENNILSTIKNINPRIFKNKKDIRFKYKIHEVLYKNNKSETLIKADGSKYLKIIHTGYDTNIIKKKSKTKRDIEILRKEILNNPENSMLHLYLSKSLYTSSMYKESIKSAENALRYLSNRGEQLDIYCTAYSTMLYAMLASNEPYEEIAIIFNKAILRYPEYPDYYRIMGLGALKENKIKESIDYLKKCIYYCDKYSSNVESIAMGQVKNIYSDLLNAYILDNNIHKVVEISSALLKTDKYDYEILAVLIKTLLTREREETIVNFLTKIYDYNNFKDKIYLIKACEASGNEFMTKYYKELLTKDELKALE